jgi:antitoxin VapB
MTTKHERIINLLEAHNIDGLLIKQVANFAWATDGAASYINTASSYGVGILLLTRDARHLVTNTIEAPRFEQEEGLKSAGWEFNVTPWYLPADTIEVLTKGLKLGADFVHPGAVDLSSELAIARSYLDEDEQARFRTLSKLCADAMEDAVQAIKPGMTEYQIAGILDQAAYSRGAQPIVNLIATDERIYHFRHPLPTDKVLEKYAMLVLCGRKKGLVCSITRLVHFGSLPDDLRRKSEAVAFIDAAMIAATRPGATAADVFQTTVDAYARVGYPDEYQLHHQGGPAGYDPREFINTPAMDIPISVGQAYAWNPSITGCKSEDTILVGERGNEIMTAIHGWPSIPVEINGQTIARPAILVVDD